MAHPTGRSWLISVLTISLLAPTLLAQSWQPLGPFTGKVTDWWPSPHNADVIVVRGDLAGDPLGAPITMRSVDGGLSFSTNSEIRSMQLVAYPANLPGHIFGLRSGSILHSEDHGETWASLPWYGDIPENAGLFAAGSGTDDPWLAACTGETELGWRTLHVSADGGMTWILAYEGDPDDSTDVFSELQWHVEADTLFAVRPMPEGVPGINGLWYSADHGGTWSVLPGSVMLDGGRWLGNLQQVSGWPNALMADREVDDERVPMQSLTLGTVWEALPGRRAVALSSGGQVLADDEGLLARATPVSPWVRKAVVDEYPPLRFASAEVEDVRFHPADEEMAMVAAGNHVWQTHDGGGNWEFGADGFASARIGQVVVKPFSQDPAVIARNTKGVYRMDSPGDWELVLEGLFEGIAVHPADHDVMVAWGITGVRTSVDGGETWASPSVPINAHSISLEPDNVEYAYINGSVSGQAGFHRTTDFFESAETATGEFHSLAHMIAHPFLTGTVFAFSSGSIFRSSDGGLSYEVVNDEQQIVDLKLQADGIGAVIRAPYPSDGGPYSYDACETFDVELPFPTTSEFIDYGHDGMMVIADLLQPWVSGDHGFSWEEGAGDLPLTYLSDIDLDWQGRVFIGTERNGIYWTDHWADLAVSESRGTMARTFTLQPAYPNPFNGTTSVAVTVNRPSRVTLTVLNMLGQQVARVADGGMLPAGTHRLAVVMPGGLASGVYLLRASAAGMRDQTQRLVLLR